MSEGKEEVWKAIALCVLDTKEMRDTLRRIERLENILINLAGRDDETLSKGDIKKTLYDFGVIKK
jgi:hypothetical protein